MKSKRDWIYARVSDAGKLVFDNVSIFAQKLNKLKGARVQICIEEEHKRRSLQENNYYWGVVIPILCDWSGYAKDEMHDSIKSKFLFSYDDKLKLPKVRSTSDLSTVEFESLMSEIREWASWQGVFIPLPNEEIY